MSEANNDTLWDEIVGTIEAHISDQIRWHVEHGSTGNKHQLFDIALRMEAEKLENRAAAADDKGQHEVAEMLRALKDILPEILRDLRERI